jgi:hypothetical protein
VYSPSDVKSSIQGSVSQAISEHTTLIRSIETKQRTFCYSLHIVCSLLILDAHTICLCYTICLQLQNSSSDGSGNIHVCKKRCRGKEREREKKEMLFRG